MQRILPKTKPYYPFSEYLKGRFGCKVYKVTIDAGSTCPNRDGKVGVGGCSYCNNMGFSANSRNAPPRTPLSDMNGTTTASTFRSSAIEGSPKTFAAIGSAAMKSTTPSTIPAPTDPAMPI